MIMKNRDFIAGKHDKITNRVVRCCLASMAFSILNFQFSIAQNTEAGLSKQLEVTRAYTPRVARAEKLAVPVDMTDTVKLRPEISYRITSTASATSFETQPYAPATVAMAPFDAAGPLYLRVGVAAPLQSALDAYFTPRFKKTDRSLGLFANHSGSYSRIKNDMGVEVPATEMTNGAGGWFTRRWSRFSLEADVTYDARLYNPYGVADVEHEVYTASSEPATKRTRQFVFDRTVHRFTLGMGRAGLSFGDNFTDLSRMNFRLGVDAGYGKGHRADQFNIDSRLTMARMFGQGRHGFEAALIENASSGGAMDYPVDGSDVPLRGRSLTVTMSPRYLLKSGAWRLRAGLDLHYLSNREWGQDYLASAPVFEARVDIAGGAFVPYVSLTSHIVDGDPEALSRRNPYVVSGGPTALTNDLRVGFDGDLNDIFSYRVVSGFSLLNDYQIFVGTQRIQLRDLPEADEAYDPMWFTPLPVDGARWTTGAEVALHNLGGFGARIYGNWNKYDFRGSYLFQPVGPLPDYDAGVELAFHHADRFSVRVGAELIGKRRYLIRSKSSQSPDPRFHLGEIAPVVDVTFGADVKIMPGFWLFLEGENLANQVLYPYPHYRGLGVSVMGGVKLLF
jgi:hypothetical protein